MYWQLKLGSEPYEWYIFRGSLLSDIMADDVFKGFFTYTVGGIKEHNDVKRDRKPVRCVETNFVVKMDLLRNFMA